MYTDRLLGSGNAAESPNSPSEVSGHLLHPALIGVLGDASNDPPTGVDEYEEPDLVGDLVLVG